MSTTLIIPTPLSTTLIIPTVHLNGSSGAVLADQAQAAVNLLDQTLQALHEMAPHGRDYYPQGATAFAQAYGAHKARVEALTKVRGELREILRGVTTQLDARKSR